MAVVLRQLSEQLEKYDAALAWLGSLGAKTANTRLARYRNRIAAAIANEARRNYVHQRDPEYLNALIEASDLIDIATLDAEAFRENRHALLKLREVPKGADDTPDLGIDRPRDYGFEFATAAMLQRSGDFGGFGDDGDVVQASGHHPWECKRLSTLDVVDDRVREARKQLARAHAKGTSSGIIALDLTRPLRREHGVINAKNDHRLLRITERFMHAVIPRYFLETDLVKNNSRPCVLGVYLRLVTLGIRGKAAHVRRTTTWQLVNLHGPLSVEDQLFLESAQVLGPVKEGRVGELIAAEASVLGVRRLTGPIALKLVSAVEQALGMPPMQSFRRMT